MNEKSKINLGCSFKDKKGWLTKGFHFYNFTEPVENKFPNIYENIPLRMFSYSRVSDMMVK